LVIQAGFDKILSEIAFIVEVLETLGSETENPARFRT